MNIKDNLNNMLKGEIFFNAYKDDKFLYSYKKSNLVVNNSKLIVAGLLAGIYNAHEITKISIGDGTTPPQLTDQTLEGPNFRTITIRNREKNSVVGSQIAKIWWYIDYNEDILGKDFVGTPVWTGPFTITEMGLLSASGTLFNRIIFTDIDIVMDRGIKLEGYFSITVS